MIDIDRLSPVPLFRQIYERIRAAIAVGQLRPGERLPSARSLAAQLGAARGTVEAAFGMLAGEGWIVPRGAAGTIVAPRLGPAPLAAPRPRIDLPAADPMPRPFRMGLPALDAFPRGLWARLVAREARALGFSYPDPAGDHGLREAIAAYLAVSRGIVCLPGQIVVTAGYQGALSLIARAMIEPGTPVWIEDPGYHLTRLGLAAAGARLVPVPVDAEGMRVEAAPEPARFAFVTPSHQAPLGVPLSLPRRLALLSWAEANDAAIVEDDYDGEFHYAGRPLPALKSLDRGDVVLYAGSFSKVLFPGLRLGYLVVPARLVGRFAEAAMRFTAGCGALEQRVVARFMSEGHFARHLKRMRGLYAARRAALATALADVFGGGLRIELQSGGMHLLARTDAPDTELVALAEQHRLAPAALSAHAVAADCGSGLLLSFTNIPETQATAMARALHQAIGHHL
ncbi:MAG TPA: PLP-dependent aminotransferase family protein [Stellaceae bacterium]|nr:PLP-dependent aminotransferase family protein [Stellaceae bacterium]